MANDLNTALVPEIWSAELLANFFQKAVTIQGCNLAYQGDISKVGDKVNISALDAITIGDYTKSDITIQDLTPTTQQLSISRQKYFAFQFDTIDEFQSAIKNLQAKYIDEATQAMIEAEETILLAHYADVASGNDIDQGDFGGTATNAITLSTLETSAYYVGNVLARMERKLSDSKIPRNNRILIIPPIVKEAMITSKMITGTVPSEIALPGLRDAFVARYYGWDIYESTLCATGTGVVYMLGFHPQFMAYAGQFTDIRAMEMEKQFAVLVKGLKVWGEKVTKAAAGVSAKIDSTQIVRT